MVSTQHYISYSIIFCLIISHSIYLLLNAIVFLITALDCTIIYFIKYITKNIPLIILGIPLLILLYLELNSSTITVPIKSHYTKLYLGELPVLISLLLLLRLFLVYISY